MIFDLFERERAAQRPLVAAFIVATEGSTYRKAGAWMLFAGDGERAGLLSGGCLESDLAERAQRLLAGRERVAIAEYDNRSADDPIWGLGLGCEGLMRIALLRIDAAAQYQPLAELQRCHAGRSPGAFAFALAAPGGVWVADGLATPPAAVAAALSRRRAAPSEGSSDAAGGGSSGGIEALAIGTGPAVAVFTARIAPSPALLICGAGPDAAPVAEWASRLGWHVTVVDHRPAYVADARARFPGVRHVLQVDAETLARALPLAGFAAAIVMSHHLVADGHYLAALAGTPVPYVGLLGPGARRERLFAELGPERTALLRQRLRAPIGLDLGGRTPEAIALSIVAEIQSMLSSASGQPFSRRSQ